MVAAQPELSGAELWLRSRAPATGLASQAHRIEAGLVVSLRSALASAFITPIDEKLENAILVASGDDAGGESVGGSLVRFLAAAVEVRTRISSLAASSLVNANFVRRPGRIGANASLGSELEPSDGCQYGGRAFGLLVGSSPTRLRAGDRKLVGRTHAAPGRPGVLMRRAPFQRVAPTTPAFRQAACRLEDGCSRRCGWLTMTPSARR